MWKILAKKVSKNLYQLSKLKFITSPEVRKTYYNAHIKSRFDYCSTVWDGASDVHLKKLSSLQRRAAKIILPDPKLTTDEKLEKLDILPLSTQFLFNKGVLMHKIIKESVPQYVSQLFEKNENKSSRSTSIFRTRRPRIDLYKTSLSYSGSTLWNSLPTKLSSLFSHNTFKKDFHSYLMKQTRPP